MYLQLIKVKWTWPPSLGRGGQIEDKTQLRFWIHKLHKKLGKVKKFEVSISTGSKVTAVWKNCGSYWPPSREIGLRIIHFYRSLYIYLSIYLSIHLSIYPSIFLSPSLFHSPYIASHRYANRFLRDLWVFETCFRYA